ncbi:MAG: tetratricopeptide repeat protein [Acidobacteria bacterium]|nr:tetratricopeptide repeat protein [Acidobacteriota bacterium]
MAQTNRIALLQKAEDAARRGEYDEALGIISRCLDLYPGFSPARVLKSEILSRTGNSDAAITELRAIIASTPENIRARMILTDLLIQQNDQKQAMTHLEFLSFMVPENDPGLLDLRQRAEELQPAPSGDDETPRTLEFGIMAEAEEEAELLPNETGKSEEKNVILEDEVTEIFMEKDLNQQSEEQPFFIEETDDIPVNDKASSDEQQVMAEVLESEGIQQSEVVTVHVPEDDKKREEPAKDDVEIKTLTMARVYERQKMYTEALDILETLYRRDQTEELTEEIKRVKNLVESRTGTGRESRRERIIISMKDWMEKITCNSTK